MARKLTVDWIGLMEKFPMTIEGHKKIEEEVKRLKSVERPAVVQAIAEAREHGDLSENAEYHAAKERQGMIEARLTDLEDKLSRAEVIDPTEMSGKVIKFGATVTVADEETDEETTYQIVGQEEADLENGKISLTSPVARGLIGKTEGDSVEVKTPGGTKGYEVVEVQYI